MKILYLPIFEGGSVHDTAVRCKRGLYTALAKAGHQVTEFDYLDFPQEDLRDAIHHLMAYTHPDLLLTQLHGADRITPNDLKWIRSLYPPMRVVNWSGDSHRHSLLGEPMLNLARQCDLFLVPTLDVLPDLKAAGVHAEYWQIAYEKPVQPLPDVPTYDIVFLGNAYSETRKAVMTMLRSLPYKVGIFGDWEQADGDNKYNFAEGEALYKKARLAICDNTRVDNLNYVSDRPIQVMAAGGALCLHQRVETMQEMMGWKEWVHYIKWNDLTDLKEVIDYWMTNRLMPFNDNAYATQAKPIEAIVAAAQAHVLEHHTFDTRVRQLFEMLERIPA